MDILANAAWDIVTDFVWPLAQFLIGLGVVVFFHELGHYLAARWAGIQVERFAVGMGPRLCGVQKGETDYCLCAIPLGGYVKMLGQEDFKPVEGADAVDPRSFQAASVGKRLVVISAGVVMNVLLAALLFVILCMIGKQFPAPVVGEVLPTYPAAEAKITWQAPADAPDLAPPKSDVGLRPGDRILTLNGKEVTRFADLGMAAVLAEKGEVFDVTIRRDVNGRMWTGSTRLGVQFSEERGINQFGIAPASTLTIAADGDETTDSPFREGDRIVAVNGKPIQHPWQLDEIARKLGGTSCLVTVERKNVGRVDIPQSPALYTRGNVWYRTDGKRFVGWPVEPPGQDETAAEQTFLKTPDGEVVSLSAEEIADGGGRALLDVLGMIPRLRIDGVIDGGLFAKTPAQKAGLQPGDIILAYGERPTPSLQEFREISQAVGENPTTITVLRNGEILRRSITPVVKDQNALVGVSQGLDRMHPVVGTVREHSPAARAGVEKGAEIVSVNGQAVHSWADLFEAFKNAAGKEIVLSGRVGAVEKTWNFTVLTDEAFDPDDYKWTLLNRVPFQPIMLTIVYHNPLRAIGWGAKETARMIVSTYQSLAAMLRGSVSPKKAVQGPIGIGALAVGAAKESFMDLVYLMAFLSAVLAVFNFLPIPVLDGGHAMLILIEKARGKPLPLKFVNALQMIFLVLILGLFVVISWNDIVRLGKRLW